MIQRPLNCRLLIRTQEADVTKGLITPAAAWLWQGALLSPLACAGQRTLGKAPKSTLANGDAASKKPGTSSLTGDCRTNNTKYTCEVMAGVEPFKTKLMELQLLTSC